MEKALIALLLADASLKSVVSDRIWWVRRPQRDSELPAVVLTKISGPREYNMEAPSGLVAARVQIDVFGETYGASKEALKTLTSVINGYSGVVGDTCIQGIFIDTERDDTQSESEARHLFLTSMDLIIWHSE